MIEILTILSTILGAILFIALRHCNKGHLEFSTDRDPDLTQDYMGFQINLIILFIALQAFCPAITNILLLNAMESLTGQEVSDTASMNMMQS